MNKAIGIFFSVLPLIIVFGFALLSGVPLIQIAMVFGLILALLGVPAIMFGCISLGYYFLTK